ncbi:MAG: glycosyltransferase [Kordiimonadaceae bacterium]|nr:glycosyltransferase [Kordiimonadaceae bacterium]
MEDPIIEVISFLSDPATVAKESDKVKILDIANLLAHEEISSENLEILTMHLRRGRKTTDQYKALIINSILLILEKKPKYSKNLTNLLMAYTPSLQEGNATLASLQWAHFNGTASDNPKMLTHCSRPVIKKLFEQNLKSLTAIYDEEASDSDRVFEENGRVVIITKQMQIPPHAPSVRTLEFSKNLIEDHGKQVLIVCSAETSIEMGGAVVPATRGLYAEPFLNATTIQYEGHDLPFLLCGKGAFSEASARQGIRAILDFKPEMILSIGAPNLLGEVFHQSAFCFFYMSGRDIPITKNHYFHTWEPLSEDQKSQLERDGVLDQHLFVSTPGYHVQEKRADLAKADFQIPQDAFVFAIIGLRLEREVDTDFLDMLEVISKHTGAHFLFAGQFLQFDEAFAERPALKKSCHFIGMHPDIMAVYGLCDAYINPKRQGGGSSAAQALQAGIPVLATPGGDVGFMAVNMPVLETYADLAEAAVKIQQDDEFMATYKNITASEASRVSVRGKYLSRIMEEFKKFAEKQSKN